MGKPHSNDLRHGMAAAVATDRSCRDVAAGFGAASSTAGNWYRRHQQTQSHAAFAMGGDRPSKLTERAGWIAERLRQAFELTLGGVPDKLAACGITVSCASVWRMVRRLGGL